MPSVSILTPAFNVGRFVDQTVASAQAQTFADWELIVVDDGSTDDTGARVESAARRDPRIRLVSPGRNQGIAASRNLGIDAARGRFLAFLDADDLWDTDKLERQLQFMNERSATLSFTGYRLTDESGARLGNVRAPPTLTYRQMLRGHRVGCLTVMVDREKAKLRFPAFPKASDLAGWLSVLREGHLAHGLDAQLATYRVVRDSISRRKARYVGRVWEVYRAQPLPKPTLALYYAEYAVRGFLKHIASGAVRVRAR